MSELKPCPFCGSEADVHPHNFGDSKKTDYTIYCSNKDCGSSFCWYDTPEESIKAWNKRAVNDKE